MIKFFDPVSLSGATAFSSRRPVMADADGSLRAHGIGKNRRMLGLARGWGLAVLALLVTGLATTAQAQVVCDSRMWLSQSATVGLTTQLYAVGTGTNPFTYTATGAPIFFGYNAGDFNPADGFIYAIRNDAVLSPRLVRIDPATGAATTIGTVSGLPGVLLQPWFSGAFNPADGLLYVMDTGNQTPNNIVYAINVTTNTVVRTVTLTAGINIADFAFSGGALYGVDGANLVSVTISGTTGTVATVGPTGLGVAVFGGMVGAPNGIFGFNNSGGFYQFDPLTGKATLISDAPASALNEAYHCATAPLAFGADLGITKTNTPGVNNNIDQASDTYTPGTNVTYTIAVSNNGPFGALNQTVTDTLPAGINPATVSWTCAATVGSTDGTNCGAVSGTGAINDSGVDLSYSAGADNIGGTADDVRGTVTYTVTVPVPASYTGNLVNTAQVVPSASAIDGNSANNSATDTDPSVPRLTIRKISAGGFGGFGFSGTNGVIGQTLTTTVAGTPVSGTTQGLSAANTATSITEAAATGYLVTDITCTGMAAGGTATPNLSTQTVVLNAAATAVNANIVCTFTNTKQPVLRLQKSLPNGRFIASDQFTLSIAGTGAPAPVTTTGTGSTATGAATVNPATIGATYNLSETAAAGANLSNYVTTWSCTNALAGGQTPGGSGTNGNITPVTGDDLTCTFVNTRNPVADLTITKTNTPGVNNNVDQTGDTVTSGNATTYSIVVSNAGPDAANGSIVRDTPAGGLTCTQATCTSTSGGATCPVETGAALLTGLQQSGVAIPQLPAGGSVTLTLTCAVP